MEWFRTTQVYVVDSEYLQCYHNNKTRLISSIPFNQFKRSCRNVMHLLAICLTPTLSVVACLSLIIFIYKYKWSIKWRFYLIRQALRRQRLNRSRTGLLEEENNIQYKAFVSYSQDDYDWIQHVLSAKVENEWGLKLCIGDRDFPGGVPVPESVCSCMEVSQFVILVISQSYASCNFCDFETHMALVKGRKHLIIIYKEEVDMENMSKTLQGLLSSTDYIEYHETNVGHDLFWTKLRDALNANVE